MTGVWGRAIGWGACAGAILLLLAALVGARVEAAGELRIDRATVQLPTVPGRPAAGYFTLGGGTGSLTSVASPLASRVEMHSNSMAGGVMRMDKLPSVMVRAGETVRFAPGGNHLMIYGLPATLKPGATVPLVFSFEGGKQVRAEALAVAPGGAAAGHGAHGAHGTH